MQAAAAVGLEFIGIMFVPFFGISQAATALVGNDLGSNNPEGAQRVVRTAPILHPFVLVGLALVILLPAPRHLIIQMLAHGGSPELRGSLDWVVQWVVLYVAFDGMQSILVGILTGAGLQRLDFNTNMVVFPFLAVPLVLLLSKPMDLGLKGLFYG